MRKTKQKNDMFWQAGTLPFVGLWAASYAAAWLGVLYFIEWLDDLDVFYLSTQQVSFFAISFILLFSGLLHVQIVERLLKQSMRKWMLYTLVGTVITFFTFRDSSMSGSNQYAMLITSLSLLVPVSIVQTVWLWRRVKDAWLWPLASLVAAIVFILPMRGGSGGDEIMIVATILYGLIQGGIMRYLWTQPKETEKSKVDFAVDDDLLLDGDREQRLKDTQHLHVIAPWSVADEHINEQKFQ
jgi:hypothetical protein